MDRTVENTPVDRASIDVKASDNSALRLILLAVLGFGLVGLAIELLLLGHTEETPQWIPLITVALGLVASTVLAIRPSRKTVIAFRIAMTLFVIASLAGLYFHYTGNVEFELEMYPSMAGMELFKKSMTGATPALAPGMMAQLGLMGLAITWRHPALRR
jgi:hypothetical protein